MNLLDGNRVQIRWGRYGTAPATALVDAQLHLRAQDYRRSVGMRMQPLDCNDIRRKLPEAEYHVSRKVDGEFDVLLVEGGEALLVNPGGLVRIGLPALDEAARLATQAGLARGVFAVELHVVRPDGKRCRVHDVTQASRQPGSDADLAALRIAVFDAIELDGRPVGPSFADSWREIGRVFGPGSLTRPVDAVVVRDSAAVAARFAEWVDDEGSEGLVARSDAAGLWKIKRRHTLDAAVIGFTEGVEDRQGMIHDLLLALMRPDGTFHIVGRVGGGFEDDERRGFLSDLKDTVVESDYAEVNDHVAYQMVRPEWVIEISYLDLMSQTTRGAPVNRMVLKFDGKWEPLRRLPLAAVISPQFIRRRDDKRVHPADLRIEQVSGLVEVDLVDKDASQMSLRLSEVLRREVYTKELKGQTMVRKFVMWKTNKETESEGFPAYVVHFTDFSPNRKTPLDRDIRVSSSWAQICQLWEELKAANVKQGWQPVAAAPATAPAATDEAATAAPAPAKRGRGKAKAAENAAPPDAPVSPAVTSPPESEKAAAPAAKSRRGKAKPPSDPPGAPVDASPPESPPVAGQATPPSPPPKRRGKATAPVDGTVPAAAGATTAAVAAAPTGEAASAPPPTKGRRKSAKPAEKVSAPAAETASPPAASPPSATPPDAAVPSTAADPPLPTPKRRRTKTTSG